MEEFLNTQNGAKWCKIDKWPCWNIQPLLKLLLAFCCCDCFNDWQGFVWSGNHRQEVDTEKQNQNQQRLSNEKTWCCIRRIRQGRFWCKHWAPGCCGTDLLSHSWSRFVGQIINKYDNDTNIIPCLLHILVNEEKTPPEEGVGHPNLSSICHSQVLYPTCK